MRRDHRRIVRETKLWQHRGTAAFPDGREDIPHMRITSPTRMRTFTSPWTRALVLAGTACALMALSAGPAHADIVGDLVNTVQTTVGATVDTAHDPLDDAVEGGHDAVDDVVSVAHDTVGGAVPPGRDEPAPDPSTHEGPTPGPGTNGSGAGHHSGAGRDSGGAESRATAGRQAAGDVAGPSLVERPGVDPAPAGPNATGGGGSLLDGSLTPPRGPTEPGSRGFGAAPTRFAVTLLVAALAVVVLFHAGALWLRMTDQPSGR
jgi:hypothetical protein